MKFNKKISFFLILSLLITHCNICLSEDDAYSYLTKSYEEKYRKLGIPYRREVKDDVVYILPAREKKQNRMKYIDLEGRKRFEEAAEKEALETGDSVAYIMEGIPDEDGELEYFEVPPNEKIEGCIYPKGYSYPENCISDDGEHIFKAGRDTQETLDKIASSKGIVSQYNKIPNGYDPHSCSVDENGIDHPCTVTKVIDLISQKDPNDNKTENTSLE